MKLFKKFLLLCVSIAMVMPMFAFVNTDMGVEIKGENGKFTVFKEITVPESKLSLMNETREKFIMDIQSHAQSGWTYKDIETYSNGEKMIGGRFTVVPEKKKYINSYITLSANGVADFFYSPQLGLGKKTVTIKIKPQDSQVMQFVSYYMDYNTGDTDNYYFVVKTPGKVTKTDGEVLADGKTVRWDIKDALVNKKTLYLTVSYSDFTSYIIILGVIALIVGAVFMAKYLKNKKSKVNIADDSITPYVAPKPMKDSDDLFGSVAEREEPDDGIRKCPECGYPLKDDDTFCVNCGKFFE